ncbi:PPE family protein [Mycobacterium vicinigordonae]|uniref:PPE family protein n=1 Tax=Mycobacterium vicinigordonae TaxID=1719132 RepID=A0A7D6I912_9MYCO|nr:PPE family protein [Mycobacterium vicinigordonae]QLL10138.1 PPE family protein [Mycobacterium vicinigordonae]
MDFGALPPEVNSALMYAGAGTTPLLAAGAAWNSVAAELSAAASEFESVVTRLTTEQWMSPAARTMAAAARPFSAWLSRTADCLAGAAGQARASAAAFEAAFAAVVPPAEIAANRALLAELTMTNPLVQNMSAIAATEARYGEMWAQDAAAMYGYAADSAMAGRLEALSSPSAGSDPAATSAIQADLAALIGTGSDAMMGLASPGATASPTSVGGIIGLLAAIDSLDHPFFEIVNHVKAVYADFGANFSSMVIPANDDDATDEFAEIAAPRAAGRTGSTGPAVPSRAAPVVSASRAATSVGRLSVPTSWLSAAPPPSADPLVTGTGWVAPDENGMIDAVPPGGLGLVPNGGRPAAGPRYGVKPTVMPKHGAF